MTLCPISMFSRILAIPSMRVPATHAGLYLLAKSVTRPAAARVRWMVIRRLMYAASAAPREASMSARIWSSSRPSASTSSSVRWVYSLTSEMAMCRSLDVEGAVTGGDRHAGLDGLVGLEVLLAAAQVSDPAGDHRERAGVADAHPAAVRHADPCLLSGL